jgi:RNA polymerase sigma factor (sigma-70 family)
MFDEDIIMGIKNFENEAAENLYTKHKDYSLRFMNKMYYDEEANKDIYQDAVIVLIEKIRENKLILENTSIQTYLNSICRNQVLIRLNNKYKPAEMSEDWEYNYSDQYTEWFDEQADIKTNRLNIIMEELEVMKEKGQICYELLRKAFYENKSMEEIARLLNYTNADNAKNQSYRCRERLKKQVFDRLKQ